MGGTCSSLGTEQSQVKLPPSAGGSRAGGSRSDPDPSGAAGTSTPIPWDSFGAGPGPYRTHRLCPLLKEETGTLSSAGALGNKQQARAVSTLAVFGFNQPREKK